MAGTVMRKAPEILASIAVVVAAGGLLAVNATPVPKPRRDPARIEVAITVDDLTRPPFDPAQASPEIVLGRLADAFARHRLPPVTGFLNGSSVERHPEDEAAVARWLEAGNRLGSHTYSHLDLGRVDVPAFLADIDRNEAWLEKLSRASAPARDWRVFRYPFLQEGATESAREAVRTHLFARGYRIAQVTVDFEDWEWFPVYARCSGPGAERDVEALRDAYRAAARTELLAADARARELFGRPIRQILLLHAGAFTAEMIEDLLAEYEAIGVRFISLDAALEDPVYQLDPRFSASWGATFLAQVELGRGHATPAAKWPPHGEIAALCSHP
jgi:peptidoglycan/xylan/chitin deacetylase (PgdA/CDA1 family)